MIRLWGELRLAGSFLTVLPVGPRQPVTAPALARSLACFPLVGLGIGLLLAGADRLLQPVFPSLLVDGLLLLLLVLLTGALHLDGVADVADGLGGGHDPATRLRIMKDSRVGAMGVVALVLLLLLKFVALGAVPAASRGAALLLLPAAGRWLPVALAVFSPYARPEGGTGGAFVDHAGRRELLLASLVLAVPVLWLCAWQGAALLALLLVAALLLRAFFLARLGGVTGDVLGAAVEGGELLTLLVLAFHSNP